MNPIKIPRSAMQQFIRVLPELFFFIVGLILSIRLFRLSSTTASDFEVYWYAIHAWVSGHSPYGQYSTVYNGLVFKYPPWILPTFLPFAWLSLESSKVIWTIAQLIGIAGVTKWLIQRGVHRRVAYGVCLLFWWMWLAHAYFGQIMIFILWVALWACEIPGRNSTPSGFKISFLAYGLSAKVFSLISLTGMTQKFFNLRTFLFGFLILIISHFLLCITSPHFSCSTTIPMLKALYQDWVHAASSGGSELGAKIVRGQQNHGFVAAILRLIQIDATQVGWDIWVAIGLGIILGLLWHRYSQALSVEEKWSGWLSIGVIAHPLAWHHSFIMTYPLCAFSLHKAIRSNQKPWILLALFGICLIGIFIPQVIGTEAVKPLEFVGSKSWGVVICAWVLILAKLQEEQVKRAEVIHFSP